MGAQDRILDHLKQLCSQSEPGTALPSVRQLCREFGASPVTVTRALASLSEQGWVDARPGHGTFVRRRGSAATANNYDWQTLALGAPPPASMGNLVMTAPPGALNFASGYMDNTVLPERELSRATTRAFRRASPWQRAPIGGIPELREWFAERVAPDLSPDNVLIVHGGQAALGIAIRAIVPVGGTLLLESPTYLGPLVIARSAGIHTVPIPVDDEGIRSDYLEEALRRTGSHALYLQPNFSNPTGSCLSPARREQVLALAQKYDAFVLEDDYARDLSFSGHAPPALFGQDQGQVVYVRSLTKSVAPSLRVAALCARGPVLSRLRAALLVDDFFVPRPLQEIALELVNHSSYGAHLRRLQQTFSSRMRTAAGLLRQKIPECQFVEPQGGYSLWLRLPERIDEDILCSQAQRVGVLVNPGHWWFAAEPVGKHLRLSVAGIEEDALVPAVERLRTAIDATRSGTSMTSTGWTP